MRTRWHARRGMDGRDGMKPDLRQQSLFPTEPFELEPSPEEIALCPKCGRQIIVRKRNKDGTIRSEYRGKGGLCWPCSFEGTTDE